jgi:hypothetical protein
MARGKNRPKKEVSARPQPVAPQLIYEARLETSGAVIRMQPPIDQAQAVAIRQKDGNVVVCGPNKTANSVMARDIEQAASGHSKRCKPHINAGPHALPHYSPTPEDRPSGTPSTKPTRNTHSEQAMKYFTPELYQQFNSLDVNEAERADAAGEYQAARL